MTYSQVGVSWEPKVIGVTNGIYQFEIDAKQFEKPKGYEYFILSFLEEGTIKEFLKTEKPILKAKLLKKAKATDFMGYSQKLIGVPFAVSKRALKVLEQFALGEHYKIEVKFVDSTVENYYLLWFPFTEADRIDFSKSVVYSRGNYGCVTEPRQYHAIRSYEKYLALREKFKLNLFFEKIILHKVEEPCDFVQMRMGGNFVSDRLLKSLEERELTGLKFSKQVTLEDA
jgi:hypothetical protein